LFIEYLEKGKTITGEYYYSNLLTTLDKKIREKRRGLQKKKLAMGKLRDLHYELLEHPPHSPDLAPSDFYLFPKLKNSSSLVGVFLQIKRQLQLLKGILQILQRTTTGT
jgi:histone-lysine N-methyltransferase SETMAR